MTHFLRHSGVEQHITNPYYPNSNGIIERSFFSVKDIIFCCSQEKGKKWDKVVYIIFGLVVERIHLGSNTNYKVTKMKSTYKNIVLLKKKNLPLV